MPNGNALWIPPLPPKAQKKVNSYRRELFKWTGFSGKTLWDWLLLLAALAIPVAIAIGTMWFSAQQNDANTRIAQDQQQETALQTYLDQMSSLLLYNKLKESQPGDVVRDIARARTLTVLPQLNGIRKGELVRFLKETSLINQSNAIISLYHADLSGTSLVNANLSDVDLSGADLSDANLSGANLDNTSLGAASIGIMAISLHTPRNSRKLYGANLHDANLQGAYLYTTKLDYADLSNANLYGASVTSNELQTASSLQDTIMPDGSKHP